MVPESSAYMDLLAFEQKLDNTIQRKRLEIQESLKRPGMTKVHTDCIKNVHTSCICAAYMYSRGKFSVAVFTKGKFSHQNQHENTCWLCFFFVLVLMRKFTVHVHQSM